MNCKPHKLGLTSDEIRNLMTISEYERFCEWMAYQTVAECDKCEKLLFYRHDVNRFLDLVRNGKKEILD